MKEYYTILYNNQLEIQNFAEDFVQYFGLFFYYKSKVRKRTTVIKTRVSDPW
jgi:hypothetical protein